MIFLAVFSLRDDLRDGVREAIEKASKGGIAVRMLSGDNVHTATKTAVEAGILPEDKVGGEYSVMTGDVFWKEIGGLKQRIDAEGREVLEIENKSNFKKIIKNLRVLARCRPEHKLAVIVGIKEERSGMVAMTGDSLNDARALQHADVGFAIGSGCEVTKDAAKIIITNDNFCATVDAVSWGRNVYDNIRKFLVFQMTVNIVALFIVFLAGAILGDSPLQVIQLLWINLVMDTLAALALATEPPSSSEIRGRPVRISHKMMSPDMWRAIFGMAAW